MLGKASNSRRRVPKIESSSSDDEVVEIFPEFTVTLTANHFSVITPLKIPADFVEKHLRTMNSLSIRADLYNPGMLGVYCTLKWENRGNVNEVHLSSNFSQWIKRNGFTVGQVITMKKKWHYNLYFSTKIYDDTLRQRLSGMDTLSEEVIDGMVSSFLKQVEDGTWESGGWPKTLTDSSISKLAGNAFTRLTAKQLSDRLEGQKIYINYYCPGWVKTAITGYPGSISAEDGADTCVWLALLPDLAISGKFFAERRVVNF